jgi:hypothetical protein
MNFGRKKRYRDLWYGLTSIYWCCQSVLQASVGCQGRTHSVCPLKRTVMLGRCSVNVPPCFVHVRRRNGWMCSDFEKHMHSVVAPCIAVCYKFIYLTHRYRSVGLKPPAVGLHTDRKIQRTAWFPQLKVANDQNLMARLISLISSTCYVVEAVARLVRLLTLSCRITPIIYLAVVLCFLVFSVCSW